MALQPSRTIKTEDESKRGHVISKSSSYWPSFLPRWLRQQGPAAESILQIQQLQEIRAKRHGSRPKIASVLAELRSKRQISPLLLPRQEQDTCPNEEPPPEGEAQDLSDSAYGDADEASDEADALAANDTQKQKAEDAAQEAEAAATKQQVILAASLGLTS